MQVYQPSDDSYLLQKYVESYSKVDSVLDLGTGSGIQAITASKYAKNVTAVDINPHAIKYARKNAEGIKNIKFIESDLFSKVKGKFDLILFNPPYLPEEQDGEIEKDVALVSGKNGLEITEKFLDKASCFLNADGKMLLISSSFAKQELILEYAKRNLLEIKVLEKKHVFFEDMILYEIVKSDFLKKIDMLNVTDAKLFSRGKRGIIIKAMYKGKDVAVKSKRDDSKALGNIEREAMFLKILNKHDIGPRLIMSNDFLMYEFVNGIFIDEFLKKSKKKDIIAVLNKIFLQLNTMDKLGINKFEMIRPYKHILIEKNNPVMIDFERCRYTDDSKNVSQFLEFLVRSEINETLKSKEINIKRAETIMLSKEYKKEKDLKPIFNLLKK